MKTFYAIYFSALVAPIAALPEGLRLFANSVSNTKSGVAYISSATWDGNSPPDKTSQGRDYSPTSKSSDKEKIPSHPPGPWTHKHSTGRGPSYPSISPGAVYSAYLGMNGSATGRYQGAQQSSKPAQYLPSASSAGSTAAPQPGGDVVSSGGITLPAGCEQKNGIGIGWLPGAAPLADIESTMGVPACFDGQYAQITIEGTYTDSNDQLLEHLDDITNAEQTIFVASVMPTIPMSGVDSKVAAGVASVLGQFTAKGIEVWLRFAHEMNYYTRSDSQGGHYTGSAADFQTAWKAISDGVASNPKIRMFWSPNSASSADLKSEGWYPTSGTVDIVGIDVYPKSEQTFEQVYGDFCHAFSSSTIPFAIGETGAGPDLKEYWLGQISSAEAKTVCPNYIGFSWFEYNKEQDFRVVTGGSDIAKSVLG